VLGERRTTKVHGYESRTVLLWLDVHGQEERQFSEAASNSDSELLSPDDLAVTSAGEVVVVDVIRHLVAVFGIDGRLRRTIDLEKAWGREPSYPSGISSDLDGGFIVEDFHGAVPFVRMRADGSVRGQLRPRYADGRPTGRLFRVRADVDGTVWGSDGEALLRLGEDGIVEGAAGALASAEQLGEVASLVLDAADRIYAADRRSGSVHVYSPDGKLQHVCRPDPGDVREALESPSLTVTDDGRVFLRPGDAFDDEGGFLEFSPDGERIGRHPWRDRARLWNPSTRGFWAVGFEDLAMVDDLGRVGRTVARRLDRRWLEFVTDAVVAPDGSIAAMAHANLLRAGTKESTINVFDADGVPTRMLRLPGEAGRFAYDGRSVAAWQAGEVWLFAAADTPVARFRPRVSGREATGWPLLIAARGRELWMLDASTKAIHRFELP
jgi:sugar lactone lactonase YvrE